MASHTSLRDTLVETQADKVVDKVVDQVVEKVVEKGTVLIAMPSRGMSDSMLYYTRRGSLALFNSTADVAHSVHWYGALVWRALTCWN